MQGAANWCASSRCAGRCPVGASLARGVTPSWAGHQGPCTAAGPLRGGLHPCLCSGAVAGSGDKPHTLLPSHPQPTPGWSCNTGDKQTVRGWWGRLGLGWGRHAGHGVMAEVHVTLAGAQGRPWGRVWPPGCSLTPAGTGCCSRSTCGPAPAPLSRWQLGPDVHADVHTQIDMCTHIHTPRTCTCKLARPRQLHRAPGKAVPSTLTPCPQPQPGSTTLGTGRRPAAGRGVAGLSLGRAGMQDLPRPCHKPAGADALWTTATGLCPTGLGGKASQNLPPSPHTCTSTRTCTCTHRPCMQPAHRQRPGVDLGDPGCRGDCVCSPVGMCRLPPDSSLSLRGRGRSGMAELGETPALRQEAGCSHGLCPGCHTSHRVYGTVRPARGTAGPCTGVGQVAQETWAVWGHAPL